MSDRLDWVTAQAPAGIAGEVRLPGDKSISHRSVMLGSLARGVSRIRGFLEAEDTRATARILTELGVRIEVPADGERIVHGVGLHGLRAPPGALDCGNSGTGMRLLAGMLAGQAFDAELTGDASLTRRPMRRITEPLGRMGARIDTSATDTPPLRIHGGRQLHGIDYASPVASAQVKSAVLLAGLFADGETRVREPKPTRDYTERMLSACGWPVEYGPGEVRLSGGHELRPLDLDIPADFSSAAFFITAATLVPGSHLRMPNVGVDPRRTGLLRVLRAMGAQIGEANHHDTAGSVVADLVVRHAPLHGIEVPMGDVADMIDEFPALFVAAACAKGPTTIRGAAELRVKESDRIAVMAAGLRALGAMIEETPDGAVVTGGVLHGGSVDACADHRCAMSFAIAGAMATAPVTIRDCANVATSFPGFLAAARACGFALETAGRRHA